MDTPEERRETGKWLVGIVACCCLIYLGMRYFSVVVSSVSFLLDLVRPILIGMILALILNVPMNMFERLLRKKTSMKKGVRVLSIILALVLIAAIIVAVAVLVIPKLVSAIGLIVQIISEGLDGLEAMDENPVFQENPLGKFLADIDWSSLKTQLEKLLKANSDDIVDSAVSATGSIVGGIVNFVVALVFAIYILAGKEKLKRQTGRLVRAWLPDKIGEPLIHVCHVCSSTFQHFIGGQATEAVILGSLCMIGMLILHIPYAAMVGALVGVTAMIPIVGAYVSAAVAVVMILTVSPFKALVFLIFFVILQQTENNLIYPRVVGSKINLPAMWVLAAVTVGGKLGGPIGMMLGVPAASAIYSLLREATEWREERKRNNSDGGVLHI
ncbi:MAG: AI-2E family transporter [Clostridiales bacterium]|nr:AI-2E family transporter [Clostridiales bacterium]